MHTYALCVFHRKTCQVKEIMAGSGQELSELFICLMRAYVSSNAI